MRKSAVWLFLIPSLAGFLVFFFIPMMGSLYYAFDVNGTFGFDNFIATVNNEAFQLAFMNTLRFMAVCVPLNLILPLLVALAVKTLGDKSRVFRLAYISPMVVPVASVALFWSILFAQGGTVNHALSFIGLGETGFLTSGWAMVVVALVFLWKNLGYMMVLYIAGLSEIPKSFYESAAMDGAGGVKKFFHITVPTLRPTIFFVLVLSVVNSFKVFREIYVIAGPYPDQSIYMLQHYMNNMFTNGDYTRLSTAAWIIAAVIILFLLIIFRVNHRAQKRLEG